jgi:intein/homing endonuclease
MDIKVSGYAWIRKSDLTDLQLHALRNALTILPRKVGNHPGDDPKPIRMYEETETLFGMAREYYLARIKPHHVVSYDVSSGDKSEWTDLSLSTTLRGEQAEALAVLSKEYESGRVGAIIKASPGWGKSTRENTYITDYSTGERKKISEFVDQTPLVPSLQEDGSIGLSVASKVWKCGFKECFRLQMANGQWLEASLDHPVLTPDGYRELRELQVGDFVASARTAPEPRHPLVISDAAVISAALLMADGSLTSGHHVYYKSNPALVEDFERNIVKVPGSRGLGRKEFTGGCWNVSFLGLDDWVKELGIDTLSKLKRVPSKFFGLDNRQLGLFLNRLFTDGNLYTGEPRKIELCMASEGLIDDVQELLRRFGVLARKYFQKKSIKQPDGSKKFYDAWRLQISDSENITKFFQSVGPIKGNEEASHTLIQQAQEVATNTNWDVVPCSPKTLAKIGREVGVRFKVTGSVRKNETMGRNRFLKLCNENGYHGDLRKAADKNVVWERVTSIKPIGMHDVYDLTVPGTANAVANGLVVHNTVFGCALMAKLQVPTLVIVHKEFLMSQWRERIEQFLPGAKIGYAQGDICDYHGKHVVIGMVHSLGARKYPLDFYRWPGLTITDEMHRIGAATWAPVPSRFPTRYRLGLSATPRRKDGAENVFYWSLGPIVFSAKEQRMKPKVRRVQTDFKLVATPKLNPALITKQLLLKFLCASTKRNKQIVDQIILAVQAGRKCIVLSERLEHLKKLEELLAANWPPPSPPPTTGQYVGGMEEEDLNESKTKNVIFATSQFVSEGFDLPALDTLFLTTPMSDVEQAVGRILRPFEGKKDPVVVDFIDGAIALCVRNSESREKLYERIT